jgi:hypothetical protein
MDVAYEPYQVSAQRQKIGDRGRLVLLRHELELNRIGLHEVHRINIDGADVGSASSVRALEAKLQPCELMPGTRSKGIGQPLLANQPIALAQKYASVMMQILPDL